MILIRNKGEKVRNERRGFGCGSVSVEPMKRKEKTVSESSN
jgi:hypothetical protein